jgi:uncharacterized protein YaaQ
MKMVLAVIQADDALVVTEALVTSGYRVTRIATTGGWLRAENATLLVGVPDRMVDHVLRVLQRTGQRRKVVLDPPAVQPWVIDTEGAEVEVGGATVFVLDVEQNESF